MQRQIQERDKRISDLTVTNQIMQPKADYFDQLVDRNDYHRYLVLTDGILPEQG